MKNRTILFRVLPIICLLYSCGGVIGNIKKFRFHNISKDSLESAIEKVYIRHPNMKDFDSTKYKEKKSIGDGDYYCRIKENKQDYFFKYAFPQYPPPNDSIVEIALTSAAIYGQDLNLAKDIKEVEKNKYSSIFEKYFITEIRKELKK